MAIYNIAGIILDFTYHCDPFFIDNIEKYQVSDETKADYFMSTEICDSIDPPTGKPSIIFKNRQVFQSNHDVEIVNFDPEGKVQTLITHTLDFKEIRIKLSKRLKGRLAEQEYMLTGYLFCELATLENKLAIHGAAFMAFQQAIIIVASSGMGKSTHANHWKAYTESFLMINEDRPLISMKNNQFYVSGTPWSGNTKANNNVTVPLKTIVFYHPDTDNYTKRINTTEKIEQLMNHALRPRGEVLMNHALKLMDELIRHCELIEYHAIDDPTSIYPLYQAIFGGSP